VIVIDGSLGEGGGQVLRSALSLSLLTRQAFTLNNIRADRPRPGLCAQHLAAVQAAAQISHARVEGDRIGSKHIIFSPGPIVTGDYHFDIGTAGATSLVFQTLLLPLAQEQGISTLSITGGTHVPWSPCYHYLAWHWDHMLSKMGVRFELKMIRAGFYPQGGGEIQASMPGGSQLQGINLIDRGKLLRVKGLSGIANLPQDIAERQRNQTLSRLKHLVEMADIDITIESFSAYSKGTVLLLLAEFEYSQACFFALGARGKPAEQVADEAVHELAGFLKTDGAVDAWLADQLLVPMAMAANGNFSSSLHTSEVTLHLLTNAEVIRYFLPVNISIDAPHGQAGLIQLTS
jgi:RNA 3'-terminal phosphate cyclase (ATP)